MAAVIFFESVKEVYTLYICDSSKVYGVVIIVLHSFPMPTLPQLRNEMYMYKHEQKNFAFSNYNN